jgi:hypothetical protein
MRLNLDWKRGKCLVDWEWFAFFRSAENTDRWAMIKKCPSRPLSFSTDVGMKSVP